MSKMFLKMSFGALAVAGWIWAAPAAAPEAMKYLHGHVPSIVAHLTPIARLAGTNHLHLAIGLPLRNQDGMTALLQQVSDPASQNYHHYLTPAEFTAQFGPTEQDIQSVLEFAKTNGLTVTRVHGNRMLVEVDGKASDVERAFNITLHTYHHPKENRQFFAPDTEPSVPAIMPILDIQGLNNYVRPHPRIHFNQSKIATKRGSGPGGNYMGYDFRNAYMPGTTLTGTGQKVALLEFDGYLASDISAYDQQAGLPAVTLTNVLLGGFSGFPVSSGGQGEVTLDIDMVNAMAPGVSQILVYEGDPQSTSQNTILNQIAVDNSARQISSSWGWGGGPNGTTDHIFQEMILQGQTFFNASGDSCAFLPPGSSGDAPGSVDDPNSGNAPSDDPYITHAGATTLQTTGPGGPYASEAVWNWGLEYPGQGYDGVGSSGGISGYYSIPVWQQGISMTTNNQSSPTMRNTPDVALTGDNIFIIVNGAGQPGTAGTSCAAPLWAGVIALVNQQSALNGGSPVGFINPALYALAQTAAYTNLFNDVTNGNNTWSQSPNEFYAVPGYDLCTGLGSPKGTNFINALASGSGGGSNTPPILSAPVRPWGGTLSVMNGSNPNGSWFLFVQDDAQINVGTINSGWYVTLTTANPVGLAADNQLYVTPVTTNFTPGAYWPVTLAVTNYGPSSSTNVYVTDTLPVSGTGVTLVSSNATSGSVAVVGNTLTWTVGNLAISNGASLTLNFYVAANALGFYTNSATVNATTSDPNPDDDAGAAVLLVSSAAPPQLTSVGSLAGGGFQLSVTNSPNQSVIIQASTNLVTWIPIYTNTEPFTFTNFDSTNFPMRFYRALFGP